MISALIGRLGGPYIAAALAAILVFAGIQTARVALTRADLKDEMAERANERAAAERALAIEQAKNREIERQWQARVEEERKGITDEKRRTQELAAQVASLRPVAAVAPGLRDALATARLAGQAAGDAAAACNARAGAYEEALADGDRVVARLEGDIGSCRDVAAESARSHDERAAEVTGLVKGWPK